MESCESGRGFEIAKEGHVEQTENCEIITYTSGSQDPPSQLVRLTPAAHGARWQLQEDNRHEARPKRAERRLAGMPACRVLLSCVLWMAAPALLRSDFWLARVTDDRLLFCTCTWAPPTCGSLDASNCNCRERLLPMSRRADGLLHAKRLTVWYTSVSGVTRLLDGSEIRHLSLVKCNASIAKAAPHDYFTVQRLERLTVSYLFLRAGQSQDLVLGAPNLETVRVGVIHTSILAGKSTVKAYTVQTNVDRDGALPFPNLRMSRLRLPEASSVFVTFLY
ncbi:hypothetical protein GN956_G11228 [Arapaima gigas]